jgi:plastocyanin
MTKALSLTAVALLGLATAVSRDGGAFAADAPVPATHVVVIEAMKFMPQTLEIHAGDRVTFQNRDLVPHTATTKPNQPLHFDSGLLKPGDSWTVTPDANGSIHYACTFHPVMEGAIIVRPD